ncbi:hypothetical protein ODQ72_11620, partial [Escherichia coli]|nr:hypothetical protein [Escherichia coli]
NQIKSAQKKAQKKAFLVISHKSAQNHTKSPYPAPHKACRFYQAARTPPRIDHYPTRNWQLKPLFTELPVILPDTQLHYVAWMELYSPAE